MKNLRLALLAWVIILSSCKKDASLASDNPEIAVKLSDTTLYVYPTGYNDSTAIAAPINLGVPSYLEAKNDAITASLSSVINAALPNTGSLLATHPAYLSSTAINTLDITAKSDVYVTFVSEGASNKNSLAYYTYKTGNSPTASSGGSLNGAMDRVVYIFPNATSDFSIGHMVAGNKVKLGTFSAGISIGFILISNGWTGINVNSKNTKFYSQNNLNPETESNLKRHAVMLYYSAKQLYFFGFEDRNRQSGSSDNDFNDLVFYVTSSTNNSISNTNVVEINNP